MKRGRGRPKITLVAKAGSWSFIWVEDLVWEALFGDLEFFTVMFDVARLGLSVMSSAFHQKRLVVVFESKNHSKTN